MSQTLIAVLRPFCCVVDTLPEKILKHPSLRNFPENHAKATTRTTSKLDVHLPKYSYPLREVLSSLRHWRPSESHKYPFPPRTFSSRSNNPPNSTMFRVDEEKKKEKKRARPATRRDINTLRTSRSFLCNPRRAVPCRVVASGSRNSPRERVDPGCSCRRPPFATSTFGCY